MTHFFLFISLVFISGSTWAQSCNQENGIQQILILPPTGGANSADRKLFKSLCKRSHHVTILNYEQKSGLTTDLGIHDRLSREFLTELNLFLTEHPKPAVLIGASLGGLYASIAFSYALSDQDEFPSLKQIKGAVLTVTGGPLSEILARSDLESVRKQRDLRMRELRFENIEQYQRELEKNIMFDPIDGARPEARNQILMFNSDQDTVVPSNTQDALWLAWGKPKAVRLSTNHQLSIARVYYFWEEEIHQFLNGL